MFACTDVVFLRFAPLNEPGLSPYGVFATTPSEIQAMTPPQLNPDTDSRPEAFRYSRGDTAQALHDLGDPQQHHASRRRFAARGRHPARHPRLLGPKTTTPRRPRPRRHPTGYLLAKPSRRTLPPPPRPRHPCLLPPGRQLRHPRPVPLLHPGRPRRLRRPFLRRPASSGQNPTEASPRLWPKRTATPGCWHGYQEHRRLPG